MIQRERLEAQALVNICHQHWWGRWLHHSPNEEMNRTARQLAASQGTRCGFPDYLLVLQVGEFVGCALELKAPKPHGRSPTPEQAAWLEHFAAQGWHTAVAYGWPAAYAELSAYAKGARRGRIVAADVNADFYPDS